MDYIAEDNLEEFEKIYDKNKLKHYLEELGMHYQSKRIMKYIMQQDDVDLNTHIFVKYCGEHAIEHFIDLLVYNSCTEHLRSVKKYYTRDINISLSDIMIYRYYDADIVQLLIDIIIKDKETLVKQCDIITSKISIDEEIYDIFKYNYLYLKYGDELLSELDNLYIK